MPKKLCAELERASLMTCWKCAKADVHFATSEMKMRLSCPARKRALWPSTMHTRPKHQIANLGSLHVAIVSSVVAFHLLYGYERQARLSHVSGIFTISIKAKKNRPI
jgi:hypothetical protein